MVEKLPTFKPQHLANLLNAMGRLASPTASDRVHVPPDWTAAVVAHVGANLPSFSGSALASTVWGLSALGQRVRPHFLDDVISGSYGKLHTCGPTDLILFVTALGNFGFEPMPGRDGLWASWMSEFERFASRKTYDTRGVCDLMDAIARLPRPRVPTGDNGVLRSLPLHPGFVAGVLHSTRIYQLRNTSPGRLAALAGALATLGVKPDFGFLYNYAQVMNGAEYGVPYLIGWAGRNSGYVALCSRVWHPCASVHCIGIFSADAPCGQVSPLLRSLRVCASYCTYIPALCVHESVC